MKVLEKLEPVGVFKYFEELTQIPRGSGNVSAVSDYVVSFAQQHGLRYVQDKSKNVIIYKNAARGYESSEPVIIQGHLDMVCEKDTDREIDFINDPLDIYIEDGFIKARGTTLGADDGVAVAFMLALLENDSLKAPRLECCFTVDEEVGMLGAQALDKTLFSGRRMINLDHGDEDIMLVGCAGGVTAACTIEVEREAVDGSDYVLEIGGLSGGHSGEEIIRQKASSNFLLGRILFKIYESFDFRLISLNGGLKDNAIPRESKAVLRFDKQKYNDVLEVVMKLEKILKSEFITTDPELFVTLKETSECSELPMSKSSTQKAIVVLYNLPNGVQKMSPDIEGLVQTSLNMGILKTDKNIVTYSFSVRSDRASEKEELVSRLKSLVSIAGGNVSCEGDYPAWEYNRSSVLRDTASELFKQLTGKEIKIETIHAGLECGIFSDAISGFDCISIGPDMMDIHTPRERLNIESTKRCYEYVCALLERLK